MEHVSTLCASSTLGIAATGFALGHADETPKQNGFRRKSLRRSLRGSLALTTNAADESPGIRPLSPNPPQTAEAALPSISNAAGGFADTSRSWCFSEDLNPLKELPTSAIRSHRPRGRTFTGPPLQSTEDKLANFPPRRPSSSWLRRLSGISFQPESRFSTPSPVSPPFNGPGSASFSRPGCQRRSANRLVKRSTSQHSNAHPLLTSAPVPTSSAPRRPATSYQRTERLRHRPTRSLTFEPGLAANATPEMPETHGPGSNCQWRPLFSCSRPDGLPERLVRRLSVAARQKEQELRRILPSPDAVPTLLLATSVTKRRPPTNAGWAPPNPSVQFRDPFAPIYTAPSHADAPFSADEKSCADAPPLPLEEVEPGRSASSIDTADTDRLGSRTLARVEGGTSPCPISGQLKPEETTLILPLRHEKRNIADPNVFRRSKTASPVAFPTAALETTGPGRRIISFPLSRDAKADMSGRRDAIKRPSTSDGVVPFILHAPFDRQSDLDSSHHLYRRSKRHSIAASDPASTIIGSDDTRVFTSGEEDETDFLSDTAFDSIRTHLTTNSNGAPRGARIESIFDKDLPVSSMNDGSSKLESLIPRGTFTPGLPNNDTFLGDSYRDPFSTPAESLRKVPDGQLIIERVSLSTDCSDEDGRSLVAELPGDVTRQHFQPSHPTVMLASDTFFTAGAPGVDSAPDIRSSQDDGHRHPCEALDTCSKMNIFDWSEQSRNGSENSGAAVRPRTVHGKHGNGIRGSRTPGRKAAGALHLRSQSVPTPREPGIANETRQTSGKFGVWGLGSKGASEDWDGDFDFDDADESAANENIKTEENKSWQGMIVPQAIMERQDSLHGQFGLVQELTLLVEELKRLRQQATVLGIIHERSTELWEEAEGIINLATIDEEEHHSPPRSPSSLTFSFEDSEKETSSTNKPSKRASAQSRHGSLPERRDSSPMTSSHSPPRDSSPKAKFALDMVCERISQDSKLNDTHTPRGRKLPFDTQSLHGLVFRTRVVTRALKDAIRNADGVTTTPEEDSPPANPPFSRIFDRPSHGSLRDLEAPCVG